MEQRLQEAAIQGSVKLLDEILREDPLVLDRVTFGCFGTSPLHVAALRGHADFVMKVLDLNPDLAKVLDSSQCSPLHLASANGHIDVVTALIRKEPDMCLARDKDGRNPLHHAAMKGKVEVLRELVQANPYAAQIEMDRGETVLHLCVMHNQLESLKLLANTIPHKEFMNARDGRGNTILHLAVINKRVEVLQYLLSLRIVDVNATNAGGLTAFDFLAQTRKYDIENYTLIEDHLRKARAISGRNIALSQWLRNRWEPLMVVATLIATIAFQAGVSPPGSVWQDNLNGHKAGEAIMAYNYPRLYPNFVRACTTGFVTSLSTIFFLVSELPYRFCGTTLILIGLMLMTVTSMVVAYAISVVMVTPKFDTKSFIVALIVWCSLMTLHLIMRTYHVIKWQFSLLKARLVSIRKDDV